MPPFFDDVSLRREQAPTLRQGGVICESSAVLFTFGGFYGIIFLVSCRLDKLEFDGGERT